jgi:hypothetical protein
MTKAGPEDGLKCELDSADTDSTEQFEEKRTSSTNRRLTVMRREKRPTTEVEGWWNCSIGLPRNDS